jgi:hypothetical protein
MSKELLKVDKHAPSNDCPYPEKHCYFVYMYALGDSFRQKVQRGRKNDS